MESKSLTNAEKDAKEFFLKTIKEAYHIPCDVDISSIEAKLPTWYDDNKYKRGQKYFMDNRVGILNSNMAGLICLLAEPTGLRILSSTGRSSTVETARKRYVSTIIHTLSWYQYDLSPGSESWESINKVRKMHFLASKSAQNKNVGKISQLEVTYTAFGFMGLVLVRPHIFGIRHDNREDQESFVHLWAVLLHMLGVQDKFNFCLLSIEVVEVVCLILLRYIFMPLIQIETPEFKHMVSVMLEGMSSYLPNMIYETQIFQTRRAVGVPGYQYGVNKDNEVLCPSLLTQNEVDQCNEVIYNITKSKYLHLTVDIPIVDCINLDKLNTSDENILNNGKYRSLDEANEVEEHTLKEEYVKSVDIVVPENYSVRYINFENDWKNNLNDNKFYELSGKNQRILSFWTNMTSYYESRFGRYIAESLFSLILFWLNKADKKYKKK